MDNEKKTCRDMLMLCFQQTYSHWCIQNCIKHCQKIIGENRDNSHERP